MFEWLFQFVVDFTDTWAYILSNPYLFTGVAAVFGAIVGSFLNVVVFRLPVMMRESALSLTYFEYPGLLSGSTVQDKFSGENLFRRSEAPCCDTPIRWYQNIPVVSWLALKGRCGFCGEKIHVQYLVMELALALIFAVTAWMHHSQPYFAALNGALAAALVAISVIDERHQVIPDPLNLTMAAIMMLCVGGGFSPYVEEVSHAMISAVVIYGLLSGINYLYMEMRSVVVIGEGDIKLLSALALFFGVQMTLLVFAMALAVFYVVQKLRRANGEQPLGLYICLATAVAWVI